MRPSYLFSKNYPNIFHLTLISNILLFNQKKSQVFSANVRVIFWRKKKFGSNDSEMYNSARNGKKKIRRLMAVFGGSGGFAAVSSQFQNKHHKSNCHTKAHSCNSFFGWVPALVLMVSKSGTSAPPFLSRDLPMQWQKCLE